MVKIMVAGKHKLMREGIKGIVGRRPDCAVVGEVTNGAELLESINICNPDLLMLETMIGGGYTAQLIRTVQEIVPPLPILVCESRPTDHRAIDLIRAGARGYVSKAVKKEELMKAIWRVASGNMYVGEDLAEQIALGLLSDNSDAPPHTRLSTREVQVFQMLAEGISVTEISQRLHLSVKTVSTHKSRLLARLGLRGTSDLILYAIAHGLICAPKRLAQKNPIRVQQVLETPAFYGETASRRLPC